MKLPISMIRTASGTRALVRWTDADTERVKILTDYFVSDVISQSIRGTIFVTVSGYKDVSTYVRAMPGRSRLAHTLGKESFEGIGILIGVGLQAYDDWNNSNLSGAQKEGRASIAILDGTVLPVGIAHLGASLIWPNQTNEITANAFSSKDPVVNYLADFLVWAAGKQFDWSTTPTWIEVF